MSLSDKIVDEKVMKDEHDYKLTIEDFVWTKDVREFIKKLKRYFRKSQSRYIIDELAGDKLI